MPGVARDGVAWVGNLERNTLLRIHAPTNTVTSVTLPLTDPVRIISVVAESPIRVWLTLEGRHALAAFDLERNAFCSVQTGSDARWLAASADGSIWVSQGAASTNALGRLRPERTGQACGTG